MNEIGYYEEFSKKFILYLNSYLDNKFKIYYSCNSTLDVLIRDLETQSGIAIKSKNSYTPKLKLDILFAVCKDNNANLILVEAKYLFQLSLKDYSQLVGYLQVSRTIKIGLLLLIQKGVGINKLSNDFQEIIRLKKIPMNWTISLQKFNEQHNFTSGIICYQPNNGIDWINTKELHGISTFEELTSIINTSL